MSAFQPNKFQPIWRYIQKDITILSSMGSTSAARGRSSLHLFPHAGQQPAGAQQLLTFSSQLDSNFSSSPRHLQHLPSGQQHQDTRTAAATISTPPAAPRAPIWTATSRHKDSSFSSSPRHLAPNLLDSSTFIQNNCSKWTAHFLKCWTATSRGNMHVCFPSPTGRMKIKIITAQ
jgi:hypothetical protein